MKLIELNLQQFEADFFFPKRFQNPKIQTNLQQYSAYQPRKFYVLDALGLVYLTVPKAACSSIKLALGKTIGIALPPDQAANAIHAHPAWHIESGRLQAAQNDYATFSFVRNPFDRLVSCYRDKINFTAPAKRPHFADYFFSLPTQITFADFVQRVSRIPDTLADNHFKSQYALLYDAGEGLVDTVGKFEHLNDDWQPIAARYNLDPLLEQLNISRTKPDCHSDYRLYYTEPLVQLVYARYRQDIERFGYVREYEQLLAFVRMHEQSN